MRFFEEDVWWSWLWWMVICDGFEGMSDLDGIKGVGDKLNMFKINKMWVWVVNWNGKIYIGFEG